MADHELPATAETYRRFARLEAQGRSSLYEEISAGVAEDVEVLSLLNSLPTPKRQPNLLLGAFQFLFGAADSYPAFRDALLDRWGDLAATMLARRTQTNEVARCGTLLPLLISLPQPLALFEVGASAGLCLFPDRYRYDFGDSVIGPRDSPVLLHCDCRGSSTPVPTRLPEVAWRAGIDLNPIDVRDDDAIRWLEALIWPGEGDRLQRLRAAIDVARQDPPRLYRGDLRNGIGELLADVPHEATIVVFHTAVLNYVPSDERDAFVDEMTRLHLSWVANEGAGVFPTIAHGVGEEERVNHRGDFLLSLNATPMAWTDPHGDWIEWRPTTGSPA